MSLGEQKEDQKVCSSCKKPHDASEYFSSTGHYRYFRCIDCRKHQGRQRRARIGKQARSQYARRYYQRHRDRIVGRRRDERKRSPWMVWGTGSLAAKRRDGKHRITLRWSHLKKMLEEQRYRCALTGMPFWSEGRPAGKPAWDSPSLDRIDHDGPYSPGNIRIVLFCVNAFRHRMSDSEMETVALALIKGHDGTETGSFAPSSTV